MISKNCNNIFFFFLLEKKFFSGNQFSAIAVDSFIVQIFQFRACGMLVPLTAIFVSSRNTPPLRDETKMDSRETSHLALTINQSFLFLAAVICSKAPTADQPVGQKHSFIEFAVEEASEKVLSLYCV